MTIQTLLMFLDSTRHRRIRNDLNYLVVEFDGNQRRHDNQCLRRQLHLHCRHRDGSNSAVGDVRWKRLRIYRLQRIRYVSPSLTCSQANATGLFYAGFGAILIPSFGVAQAYGDEVQQMNNALGMYVARKY